MIISSSIIIHNNFLSRHVLDTLISLAKKFPVNLLPESEKKDDKSKDTPNKGDLKPGKAPEDRTASTSKSNALYSESNFWDVLDKLDSSSTALCKGKTSLRSQQIISSPGSSSSAPVESETKAGFKSSTLVRLIGLLANPVLKCSSVLTDRLLRLLALIPLSLPEPKIRIKGQITTDFHRQITHIEVDESAGLDSSLLVMPVPQPGNFSFPLSCNIHKKH